MRALRMLEKETRRVIGRTRRFAAVRGLERAFVRRIPAFAQMHRHTSARRARIVAVTGSLGKTSTAQALSAVLGGPKGYLNHNTDIGICRRILKARPWHRHVVLEVSITKVPGNMRKRVELVAPDVAIVTSIGSDHADMYPTLEATRAAKVELVRGLSSEGLAVLNGDDPNVRWMAGQTKARVLTYGFGDHNDVRAEEPVTRWPEGMEFIAHSRAGSIRVETRLLGRVMVYPLLAALAVGEHEGIPLAAIVRSLSHVEPTSTRLEPVALPNGAHLLRDHCKASVESVKAAFDTLEQVPGRRLMVLGDLSYIDETATAESIYREVARQAQRVASITCFLANNYDAYRSRLSPLAAHIRCKDVFEVVEWLEGELRAGDVVLLKGRKWQKFDRITIALRGETVRCGVTNCMATFLCTNCPFLAHLPHEVSQSEIVAMGPWGIHKVPHLSSGIGADANGRSGTVVPDLRVD